MPDMSHEDHFRSLGNRVIAGIDEAGRGPLAGPVCAAAVVLPRDFTICGLDDSKKVSATRRDALYEQLTCNENIYWTAEIVDASEIDKLNILVATHRAMALAAQQLQQKWGSEIDLYLIDGLSVSSFPFAQHSIVKGDSKSLSIAAASIIAKVTRDRIMLQYAEEFPQYGFQNHMGYGTKQHLTALANHGPCRIHRTSFQPVSQLTLPFD